MENAKAGAAVGTGDAAKKHFAGTSTGALTRGWECQNKSNSCGRYKQLFWPMRSTCRWIPRTQNSSATFFRRRERWVRWGMLYTPVRESHRTFLRSTQQTIFAATCCRIYGKKAIKCRRGLHAAETRKNDHDPERVRAAPHTFLLGTAVRKGLVAV